MAETTTTTFRFPTHFQELIGRMAKALETSRTEVVQQSVLLTAALLNEASRESYSDLEYLRTRYDDPGRIVIGVFEENELPVGKVIINGAEVDDVIARPMVDAEAGEAHMFLDILRPHTGQPQFAKIGAEAMFVAHPRFPVGTLPWPPKERLAIVLTLAEMERTAEEAARAATELIEL